MDRECAGAAKALLEEKKSPWMRRARTTKRGEDSAFPDHACPNEEGNRVRNEGGLVVSEGGGAAETL